tara:strand:- start:1182 stop:1982 length:801 start_codon:yes stop_codon:yes gene_type:complete
MSKGEIMDNSSFIKMHRKLTEWEWYKNLPAFKLFTHLIIKANYQDSKYQGILIKRGEVLTGLIKLAEQTGLTQQQIKTAFKKLKLTNEITVKSTNRFSVIKLVNYNLYQDSKADSNKQTTNKQQTNNKQTTTSKEEKEIKEEKEKKEDFKKLVYENKEIENEVLEEFFDYWSEKNKDGSKMRFEKEKTFGISRRLKVWMKNKEKWNKSSGTATKNYSTKITPELSRALDFAKARTELGKKLGINPDNISKEQLEQLKNSLNNTLLT